MILHQDIIDAVGPHQLCAGWCAGVEAAFHSDKSLFLNELSAGALLVDVSNTFNSLIGQQLSITFNISVHLSPIWY